MDATTTYDASSLHSEFNKSSKSFKTSSGGDTIRDSESSGMILARYELDIAYICEKLTNLNLLSMRVETKETDFEAFVSDTNPDSAIEALEYTLLSGFLNSELSMLETQISDLQREKANVREFLSSRKHLGEPLVEIEDMLHDSEKSLEQSLEQVLEIKIRSANFERNLLKFTGDDDYAESLNSNDPLELKENLKMQTVEHQRHILRMLEKSLEREIDLEKRVSELTQIEETLTLRLHLLEQEVSYAEEEAETALEKFYKTDHTSDILTEISKELMKDFFQREAELNNNLLKLEEHAIVNQKESSKRIVEMENTIKDLRQQNDNFEKELSKTEIKLQHYEACYEANEEEKNMFISTISDMNNVIDDMKNKVTEAGNQTESMEDMCILLSESNAELKKEVNSVRVRVKCLETSLHKMEETKKASAKDINLRSKLIMDLVMQMALERERLQKQIYSLKQENGILVQNECNESIVDPTETVRNIDARQLKPKEVLKVLLILIVPLLGVLVYQTQTLVYSTGVPLKP